MTTLDDALLRLRRLWSPDRTRIVDDLGTPVEMSTLLVVEACARHAGATIGDVAAFADVAHSTASRLVDRAEHSGFVRRQPSARNARHTAVALTERGAALRERALRARTGWLHERLRDWTDADVTRLGQLLLRFAAAVEHSEPGGRAADTAGPPAALP